MGFCATSSEGHCKCSNCSCCAPADYIETAGFKVLTDETTAARYAQQAGCPQKSLYYPKVIIMCHRIPWWQKAPGDCGTEGSINLGLGVGLEKVTGLAGAGAGAVAGVAGLAGGATAGATGAAASTFSIATLAGGITALAGLAILPFALISAHHAAAVAKETAVGCQISVSWSQFIDALEAGLQAGSFTPQQASQALDQAAGQILPVINSIAKTSGDAGALMRYGLNGLLKWYKDIGLQQMYGGQRVLTPTGFNQSGAAATTSKGLLVGGGLAAAFLFAKFLLAR